MQRSQIITHRGLEPSKENYFSESSFQAFQDQLDRGFGIEFDPNFIKDDSIVIAHDRSLTRLSGGKDTRSFRDLSASDIQNINLSSGRICSFEELMNLISQSKSKYNALHLKSVFQEPNELSILLDHINKYPQLLSRIIIFDVKPQVAKFLKAENPNLLLAPSVAHPYDIQRFNSAVHGSLISLQDALKYKSFYDWAWLDEWDLVDEGGASKQFYTKDTFNTLKNAGYKIALVTPELHGTSPGLLGGEAHPDARGKDTLFKRIKEIIALGPDAICTDYPEEVTSF